MDKQKSGLFLPNGELAKWRQNLGYKFALACSLFGVIGGALMPNVFAIVIWAAVGIWAWRKLRRAAAQARAAGPASSVD